MALAGLGMHFSRALLAVVVYRLFNFWLPILPASDRPAPLVPLVAGRSPATESMRCVCGGRRCSNGMNVRMQTRLAAKRWAAVWQENWRTHATSTTVRPRGRAESPSQNVDCRGFAL